MLNTIKQHIQEKARDFEEEMWEAALFIHDHPEVGTQEYTAVEKLTGLLESYGFVVERGVGGLDTAFRATYCLNGKASPTIAYLAEYDALPDIGHACGHNLIGMMSVGAGIVLANIRSNLQGRIVILGTPDEEGSGGKIKMVKQGVFQNIDAAMMIHPGVKSIKRKWNLAAFPVKVEFFGKSSHPVVKPFEGINALAAMIQLFNYVGLLRQQLANDVNIHGIITHGGVASNVIPEYSSAKFSIRASSLEKTYQTLEKFNNCVKGAALATGAVEKVQLDVDAVYEPLLTNNVLLNVYAENMSLLGVEMEEQPFSELGGSSDIGNVSQVVPTIHPSCQIVEAGRDISVHTKEFALAAKSELAKIAMIQGIQALAMSGADLLGNSQLLEAVKKEFQHEKKGAR